MVRIVTSVIYESGKVVMDGAICEYTSWFWQTNWLIFEVWLLVFIIILMYIVSMFTAKPSAEQIAAITFTGDYKKTNRESWNVWDVIASLGVIVLSALLYA